VGALVNRDSGWPNYAGQIERDRRPAALVCAFPTIRLGADPGSYGLLGRDFLEQFAYTIDHAAGRVTLSRK